MDKSEQNKARRLRYAQKTAHHRAIDLMRRRNAYANSSKKRNSVINCESETIHVVGDRVSDTVVTRSRARALLADSSCSVSTSIRPVRSRRDRNVDVPIVKKIPCQPWMLPRVEYCIYCAAFRFLHEVPGFCCGEGQVSLARRELLPDLVDLLVGESERSRDFRKYIRSYNNHLAFTSIGMKSDERYCWSNKGVYTLVVQGMVFHYINNISEDLPLGSNLDLYFHETDGSVGSNARRGAQLNSQIVLELISVLRQNPYACFFKSLRQYDHLTSYAIVLRSNPLLDQRKFNLPFVAQVGAIWKESDSPEESVKRDIRVYVNDDISHKVQYYYGCYDPLQYPLLFPRGEPGWHAGIKRMRKHSGHGSTQDNSVYKYP